MTSSASEALEAADAFVEVVRGSAGPRISSLAETVDRTHEFSPELWEVLRNLGASSLPFSEQEGGAGGSYAAYVRGIEAIATAGATAALYVGPTVQVASAIMRFGTAEQQERWGRPLVRGEAIGAWGFTEPQTGSDPRQVTTRAVRDGEEWVLDGAKTFISFAAHASTALVFARTSAERLGAFIVDTSLPGWQPGPPIKMMAFRGMATSPVAIDGLRLPRQALLGEPGDGFRIMVDTEAEAKIRAGAICVGIGQRAVDEAVAYACARTHRDELIGEKFPTVQSLLGEMVAGVEAARALVARAAAAIDDGSGDVKRLAASTRIVGARMAREVTSSAMQVCGAYGFTEELVLERLYREGKFYEVGQGVIELQRLIVGKSAVADGRTR